MKPDEKTKTDDNPKPETVDKAIESAEKADADFDKERQRADQADANFRKVQTDKVRLATEVEQLRQQGAEMQRKIDELTATKTATSDIEAAIPDLNPEEAELDDMVKVFKATKAIIAGQAKKLATLESQAAAMQADAKKSKADREAQAQQNRTLNAVCTRLEAKHGPGLRNKALAMMEERIAKEGEPETPAEAVLLLDECFAKVKAGAKPKGDDTVTDTGGGSGGRPKLGESQIKPGSLDEVSAQYKEALTGAT